MRAKAGQTFQKVPEAVRGAVIVPEKKHRPKLGAKQIPAFLADLDKYQGPESVKIGVHILLHCFPRKVELAESPWSEIDFDGAIWSIPKEQMKAGADHFIPLGPPGFRAAAASILVDAGWDVNVIVAQLAHKETNETRAAYFRNKYADERRELL